MLFNNNLKRMNQLIRSITSVTIQKFHKKKTNRGQSELQKIDPKNILKLIKEDYVIIGKTDINELRKAPHSNPIDSTNLKIIGHITN